MKGRQMVFRRRNLSIDNPPFVTPETAFKATTSTKTFEPEPPEQPDNLPDDSLRKSVDRLASTVSVDTLPSNAEVVERSQGFMQELAVRLGPALEKSREFFLMEALPLSSALRLGTEDAIEVVRLSTEEEPASERYVQTMLHLSQEAMAIKQAVFVADAMELNQEARLLFLSRLLPEKADPALVEQLRSVLQQSPPPAQFDRRTKLKTRKKAQK